eukprot:EG_transcript_33966
MNLGGMKRPIFLCQFLPPPSKCLLAQAIHGTPRPPVGKTSLAHAPQELFLPGSEQKSLLAVSKFPGLATFHFYTNVTPDAAPNVLYCASPGAAVSQRLKGRFARQLSL